MNLYSLIKSNLNNPKINIKSIFIEVSTNQIQYTRDLNHIRTLTFLGFEYWFNNFFYNQARDVDTKYISEYYPTVIKIKIVAHQNSNDFIVNIPDTNQILKIIIKEITTKYT